MKSIKPNKPKAMIVFYKILFPVREKRSAAVSLFPFRQISEFPTGAALLKFRVALPSGVRYIPESVCGRRKNDLPTGSWVVPRYRYDRPFARFVRRDFLCHVASDRARRPNVPRHILFIYD